MHVVAWLISVSLCIASLIMSARLRAGLVLKLALGAIIGGIALVTAIAWALKKLEIQPSHAFKTILFQLLLTITVAAMLNIMNVVSRKMVDAQGAFHRRFNAANLHRFPVSFVISGAPQLKNFGTAFWAFGSALMLYGLWFHMEL